MAASPEPLPEDALSSTLSSPRIAIDHHDDGSTPSNTTPPPFAWPSMPQKSFSSPMRHHRRTPSVQRQVKETLDARVEFTSDESDGRTHHRINQYIIMDEIGRGSYGAVHLATDQYGNEYAVKEFSKSRLRKRAQSHILRQGPRAQPHRFLARSGRRGPLTPHLGGMRAGENSDSLYLIREEIAIMKKLNHPNLVQLIEVLDDPEEDSLFIVLDMCKKGVIMKVGLDEQADPYSEEQCRYWFRDLILGIEYLHAQGVIHRDIKPDNLLLSDDDVLKIVDFGVSEMFEKPSNMRTAKSAGSPAFLPPELCGKHGDVDGRAADIWSMGVSLYCLRYGKIPFNRESMMEIYDAIKTDTPQIPEEEVPDFVDLMRKILDKDPDKRIKMPELREHAWVTKGGTDPLLSAEENCSHLVEPPNELELNRAFTRKVNHLVYMIKAIQRFKAILVTHRAAVASRTGSSTPQPSGIDLDEAQSKQIEALIAQRRQLTEDDDAEDDHTKGHAHDVSDQDPLFLGIGTGARDDFAMDEATPDVVADSPTAVDFDVYDRAYEEAVQARIQSNPTSRPTMYLTKFVKDTDQYKKLEALVARSGVAGGPSLKSSVKDSGQQLLQHVSSPSAGGKLAHQLASKMGISDGPEGKEANESKEVGERKEGAA